MSFTIRRVREEEKPSAWKRLIGPSLKVLLAAGMSWREKKKHDEEKTVREKRLKKTVVFLVVGLLCLLLLIGTMKALVRAKNVALGIVSIAGADLAVDENGFTNILLLGAGDRDHDGIDLTDTIMVASIDAEETKSAVLISIPRDTYVMKTEKMGLGRINSLYRNYKAKLRSQGMESSEASKEAIRELAKEAGVILGLEMHGGVKVNFSGFTEAIDLIGGIDVEVPEPIIDTEYPGPNYSYQTFSIGSGVQHLDGETALKYARTRHTTSDFSRSARQQQILAAAATKVKEQGIIKNAGRISELLAIMSKNVETTFSTRELMGLAAMGQDIEQSRTVSVQLSDQNGIYTTFSSPGGFLYVPPKEQFEGAFVLLPVSVPESPITWDQVQAFVSLITKHRALFIEPPSIVVLNAGAVEGTARRLGNELLRYSFALEATRNLGPRETPDLTNSVIAVNPALNPPEGDERASVRKKMADAVAALLAETLDLQIVQNADPLAFTPENADIAILLGNDYRFTGLQDLLDTK